MNQKCKVCGEPAAGFHFGAFTCEGCKSFFGRSYNNLNSITECKNNGECVINKKNRTACKACRLRKCLLVGMSKSGSRYGRRSNWFKIHCLLQEQQQAAAAAGAGAAACGGARSSPHLPAHHHGPSHHLAPPFPPHLFPGLARPRKEELALLHYEDLKGSPCLGSPDSHKSGSSPAVEDLKSAGGGGAGAGAGAGRDAFVPLPLQSLAHFPPSAFLPPPSFNPFAGAHPLLLSGALLGSPALLPRSLLDSAALRHHNNNNDVLLDDHNADSSKRFYLDEVLKSQRLQFSPPDMPREEAPSPGRGAHARGGGGGGAGVRGRRSSESPLQENPMDLSVRSDGRGADSSDSEGDAEGEGGDVSDDGEENEDGGGEGSEREHPRAHDEPAYAHLKRIKLHPLDLTTRV